MDKNLDKEQKALTVILDNTFSERLYWIMLYMRWQHEASGYINEAFGKLSSFEKLFIPKLIRKATIKSLYFQGTGRHSYDEVLEMGYKTLDAIALILGNKKYFHGNEITSIDVTAFAFLANIVWVPYEDSLKNQVHKHKDMLTFCERMWSTFYPELPKPFALVS